MSSFEEFSLLDLCKVSTGKKDANHGQDNGKFPFFTCASVPIRANTYSFDGDSIILPGNGANVGLVLFYSGKFEAYQRTYVLNQFQDFVDVRYIYQLLKSDWEKINRNAQYGSATNYIRMQNFENFKVKLPSLEEQKRIAAILDKADAVRRKRQQAIELIEQLLRSVFLDMFGDPATNPKGYKIGKIGDLLSSVNYGTSAKAGEKGKYPILRMNNITYKGDWNLESLKYIDMTEKERQKYTADPGDILFNRTNSKELVGKTAVFREPKPYIFAGYLIRSKTNSLAEPEYISGFLNSKYGKAILRNMCKSIVGMANINAKEYQSIEILIPPIEEQQKYVKITKKIREQIFCYQQALIKHDGLFNSLSQKAFRGELSKRPETELV